jgi:hypothetical protein
VKTRFDKIGYPLYCDAGPSEGDMRVDLTLTLYLSPQEYARYEGPESLRITLGEPVAAGGTAELSRERAAADARLPGRGLPGSPLPAPGEPASHSPASTAKEHGDGRP